MSTPASIARCGIALAVALVASCATADSKPVDFSERRQAYAPDDYGRVLGAWTRHSKVVRDVGTVIEVWGTYKSWDFRQAYIERYARDYHLKESERVALHSSQLEAARKSYEFHVAVQTTDFRWNDLGKEASPWRVSLVDATGAERTATAIERLKLPVLYESEFFPNRTDFSMSYLIRFDADPEGAFTGAASGKIVLRIASPLATAELVWFSAASSRER